MKKAAAQSYKSWKGGSLEHRIFRDFIEKERNNLLKEYQSNVHPLEDVPVLFQAVHRSADGAAPEMVAGDVFNIGENIYRPMLEGPWEGEDAREVLIEAIDWWERELSLIDATLDHQGS